MKRTLLLLAACTLLVGCEKKEPADSLTDDQKAALEEGDKGIKIDKGIDLEKKVVKLGALNDESGPAAAIGKPFALGKRILAAQVNAGGSGILPEGWTVELVERDHAYNPQKSVQSYNEIKDQVLYIATSFGTPNTLPLLKNLERDSMIAQPASLSSKMAENKFTPPAGPAYIFEAMRGMDHAVRMAGGADKVKAGIIYQQDDYGQDGIHGWEAAAEAHGVQIVSKQTIAPAQKDFAAVVTALKDAGATHVLLTVLPSATGPILGTSAQLQYMPIWYGSTPTWTDRFFEPEVIPGAVFANFYLLSGLPYWGEDLPGMKPFLEAYEKYGKDKSGPDSYILLSYIQGLQGLQAVKQAIEGEDATREGVINQLNTMDAFNAGGLIEPMNLTKVPYIVSTKTRLLKPKMEEKSWEVVDGYAAPEKYTAE